MRYESAKTPRGNIGVSYDSQEAADAQAAEMDRNNCTDCHDCTGCTRCHGCTDCTGCTGCTRCHGCTDCTGCTGCTDCHDCHGCTDCHDCTGCRYCTGCHDCTGCRYCTGCHDCTGCTDTKGVLRWNGEPAKNLLSLNGLHWPVATDGVRIQIGCQNHTVEQWRDFTEEEIIAMDSRALEFWTEYKPMIMALARVRTKEKQ